jgi:H+-transporting ATPase
VEKATLFNTSEDGLTEEEAVRRLEKFGKNELPQKEDNKLLKLALEFVQPMPLMIWAAIFIEVRQHITQRRAGEQEGH